MLERYHPELLNYFTRHTSDRDSAADLVQESYARVLAAQSAGRAITDPRALLWRTARNLLVDQHRRAALRQHDDIDALPEPPEAPDHCQPEEAVSARQVISTYIRTIEQLPPRCREAFVLHVFDECSHSQIASRMGISVSMVEKHLVRATLACKLCQRQLSGDLAAV